MPYGKEKFLALLSKTEITDMSVEAEQTIYTVPTGKTCILAFAWLKFSGDAGAAGVFTIGQNGAETDWVATINSDNADAALDVLPIGPIFNATPPTLKEYVAGELIIFDVATAANAVTGTLYLFGFLDDA
jgi:hypothetical protein